MLTLTPQEREAAYAQARTDLYFFSRFMFMRRRNMTWARAIQHATICNALTRVFLGQTKRLIINVPPRYSKTELAVVNFMAWALGHYPDAEFIHTSYSGGLAGNNAWNCRELLAHEDYRGIFPSTLIRSDSKARNDWRTTAGGVVYATGMGGTITGFGAGKHRPGFGGAIIIDDPHKPDEVRSDTVRNGVLEFFQNTLESRKNHPDTPIILIMQRLHEKDLSGWLLDGGNGEQWEHVCLPAILDEGTDRERAMWPEKHSLEKLKSMQQAAPLVFAGQYQQRPSTLDGNLFRPDRIAVIDAIPADPGIKWVRAWDLASSVGKGDFTAGPRLGRMPDGRLVIADMARGQWGPDERDAVLKNTAARDGKLTKISIPQDPGQAGKTQALYLTRMLAGYTVNTGPESGDKVTRAEPFASQVNVGNVLMVKAPWNDALVNEMRLFPNGNNDDQIDGLSRAFSELIAPVEPAKVTNLRI